MEQKAFYCNNVSVQHLLMWADVGWAWGSAEELHVCVTKSYFTPPIGGAKHKVRVESG